MLSRRILAASSILGQTEHTFYRFRFCSQVGKMGLFLLCFASVPPKPYAAQRRRASVVLRRRGNLITGNAAMRRCPFGEMAGGAKNAFWMVRALCVVVHLKKWLTQRCIPRTTCAAARRRASVVLECRISLFTGNAAVRRCPFGRKRVGAKISPPNDLRRIAAQVVRGGVSGTRTRFLPPRTAPLRGAVRRGRLSRKEGCLYDKKSLFGK